MKKAPILTVVGVVLVIFGCFLSFCWDAVFSYLLSKGLCLTPTSQTFKEWKDPSSPLLIDFYLFNWTNADEIFEENYRPKFVEVGPYSFKEYDIKVDVTWNKNNTISYRRRRFWYFNPERSTHNLDDIITTLNPVPLAAASVIKDSSYSMKLYLGLINRITRQKISVSKTARELLYSGISNELLTLASKVPHLVSRKMIGDKFAWFYKRNGSSDYDGIFNMETGAEDISKLGRLREWNYKNTSDFYRDECAMINGTDGTFHTPERTRNMPVEMFSIDFCRSLKFEYMEDTEVDGILGYRYVGSKKLLDNGEWDSKTRCNCNGECVPQGVLNISSCSSGAPAFVSYPHFLYADPSFLRLVDGLQPNEKIHRFHITIEPKTGIPIDLAARFQVNLLLQPYDYISMYKKVPRIFFPMFWFEATFRLPSETTGYFKQVLSLPEKGLHFSFGIIILGLTIVAIAVFKRFTRAVYSICIISRREANAEESVRT